MKIIEAIKEFPLILKKMDANNAKIQEYSSILSIETDLPFGTKEKQAAEVANLVQSNKDLAARYLKLARDLAFTNTQIQVEINGTTHSITEWLSLQGLPKGQQISTRMRNTIMSQNVAGAQQKLNSMKAGIDLSTTPLQVLRLYDQGKVDDAIRNHDDTMGMINAKLEVVNATTDLVEAK